MQGASNAGSEVSNPAYLLHPGLKSIFCAYARTLKPTVFTRV